MAPPLPPGQSRVYGYANIRRYLQRQKRDPLRGAEGSIAEGNRWGGPHRDVRQRARRLFPPGPQRDAFVDREYGVRRRRG